MSLPKFPAAMFPNSITVFLCEDAISRQGGGNPVPDAGTAFLASVQDKGTQWIADRMASIGRYKVSFRDDPATTLTRPIRAGDKIASGPLTLTATGPATNRGGYDFLWRVECEHVKP